MTTHTQGSLAKDREAGFSLIELLVAMALAAVLMTMGATALRTFWLNQAFYGSRDSVATALRQAQEDVVSVSSPYVSGIRFKPGSSNWALVRFNPNNPSTAADDTCSQINTFTFESGVVVQTASFAVASGVTSVCRAQISGASTDQFAFFFARGTATSGTVTLNHPSLPGKTATITVFPMTGRVEAS